MRTACLALAAALTFIGALGALAPAAEAKEPTADVLVKGRAFDPPILKVAKGTTVIWTNEDPAPTGMHTATSDDEGETFDEPLFTIEFAESDLNKAEVTFDEVGVVEYHCKVHADMHGEIRVVASLAGPAVGVAARDNAFDPDSVSANTSQSVNFTNRGQNRHNVAFEDATIQGGNLDAGRSLLVNFTKPGVYRYRCQFHSSDFDSGMRGEVRVANASAQLPPRVTFTSPEEGATVNGTVHITGKVASGPTEVKATGVQLRFGNNTTWADAEFDAAASTWMYMWDSTNATNGPLTIFARATSTEFPDPTPTTTKVTVNNTAPAVVVDGGGKKGGLPGFELVGLACALGVAGLASRRRFH